MSDLSMSKYVQQHLVGKSVAIVGNAPPGHKDYSAEIDQHDVVIRFNRFALNDFMGKKLSYWCVNSGRRGSDCPARNIGYVSTLKHLGLLLVPNVEEWKLKDVRPRYLQAGFTLCTAPGPVPDYASLPQGKQPTVGLAMTIRLLEYGLNELSLYGFAGGARRKYHCGKTELQYFCSEDRIRLNPVE